MLPRPENRSPFYYSALEKNYKEDFRYLRITFVTYPFEIAFITCEDFSDLRIYESYP